MVAPLQKIYDLATLNDLKLEKAEWLPLIVPEAPGSHQRRTTRGRGKLSKYPTGLQGYFRV